MARRKQIPGFDELVRTPLEQSDPHSYLRVAAALEKAPADHAAPFVFLLNRMVGRKFSPEDAVAQWRSIIALKARMEDQLGFTVDIQAAAVQHFAMEQRGDAALPGTQESAALVPAHGLFAGRYGVPDSPDYWQVRLKDEIQRSRRYSHALAAVMVDVSVSLASQPRQRQEQDLALLGKVLEDTVRTVDILTPCAPYRFLAILPDTNLREAQELAARIRSNVERRTSRIHRSHNALQVCLGAAQWRDGLSAAAFAAQLEAALSQAECAPQPPP